MTRISMMLSVLAAGAAYAFTDPASAGGIKYLNDYCREVPIRCSVSDAPRRLGDLQLAGMTPEQIAELNPGMSIPDGVDAEDHVVPAWHMIRTRPGDPSESMMALMKDG